MTNMKYVRKFVALSGLSAAISLAAPQVIAFVKASPQLTLKESVELTQAKKLFVINEQEQSVKAELAEMRKKNRKRFQAELRNNVSNDAVYQSYLFEIRDGRQVVERAKRIAQLFIYRAVRKNWQDLRNTILNDVGASSWNEFEPLLRDRVQATLYAPNGELAAKGPRDLEFRMQDWARVIVTENKGKLIRLRWALDLSSPHSDNKMPRGWETITIAE